MADVFTKAKRSRIMSAIRGKNTAPERHAVALLRRLGFKVQRHRKSLPGSPDIVLPEKKAVVFLNGCFWHGHAGCSRSKLPATNRAFWKRKIIGNMRRDRRQRRLLTAKGWRTLVLWTCRKIDEDYLLGRLGRVGIRPIENASQRT